MITLSNEGLVYRARYHPDLVAALKARIPTTARQWDGNRKAWLIAPAYGQVVADLHRQYFGESLTVPQVAATSTVPATEQRLVELRYLGTIKERGDGTRAAKAQLLLTA